MQSDADWIEMAPHEQIAGFVRHEAGSRQALEDRQADFRLEAGTVSGFGDAQLVACAHVEKEILKAIESMVDRVFIHPGAWAGTGDRLSNARALRTFRVFPTESSIGARVLRDLSRCVRSKTRRSGVKNLRKAQR